MFRLRVPIAAAAAVLGLFAGAAAAQNPAAFLPPGWSHAQINVTGAGGRAHTYIYDRGRVTAVDASSLTLKERDGSIVTIQVAPDAQVRVNGRAASLARIRRGYSAMTVGIDGAPARRVQANAPRRAAP